MLRGAARQSGTALARGLGHLTTGASSKVWYGAGDGTVHSRPCAPSQTSAVALRAAAHALQITMYTNSSCDRPKPNAPMMETMFQSANCVA